MPRKAVREHELTTLSMHDSDRLLETQPAGQTTDPPSESNSRIRDFLRHVRLLLPGVLISRACSWISPHEQRKVAAYQSRRMAILNSMLHVLPLSGALVLLALFSTKHWVGGASNIATTLQFVAKFHELLMQASLVDILLYIIRAQALDGYIPLGVLSGAARAPQLSYLWSLDFISVLNSPQDLLWRRVVFATLATLLLFLTSVVGPSSAVLMIPQPDMTHVQSVDTYDLKAPESLVFPTRIGSARYMDFSETFFEGSTRNGDTYLWSTSRYYIVDELAMWSSSFEYDTPYATGHRSVVSLPTNLAARQLAYHFEPYRSNSPQYLSGAASAVINTLQPLVSKSCHDISSSDGWTYYTMRNGSVVRHRRVRDLLTEASWRSSANLSHTGRWYAPPVWMAAPVDDPASLVVILFYWDTPVKDYLQDYLGSACTLSSYWWRTDALLKVLSDPYRVRLSPTQPELTDTGMIKMTNELRPITVETLNIEFLNSQNFTADAGTPSGLGTAWVATLARLPQQQLERIGNGTLSRKPKESHTEQNDSQAICTIRTLFHGFGYGPSDTASKLSAAVIATYCLISVAFIVYTIATGHTSIAWSSAVELIVLALQSKEPDSIGHVSVGLDSMHTFRKQVGIRVNTVPIGESREIRERLELVFKHDKDINKRNLTKVVLNKAY